MSLLHPSLALRSLRSIHPLKATIPQSLPSPHHQSLPNSRFTNTNRSVITTTKSTPRSASRPYSIWSWSRNIVAATGTWGKGESTMWRQSVGRTWEQRRGMKVRSSVKKMCDGCKVHNSSHPPLPHAISVHADFGSSPFPLPIPPPSPPSPKVSPHGNTQAQAQAPQPAPSQDPHPIKTPLPSLLNNQKRNHH